MLNKTEMSQLRMHKAIMPFSRNDWDENLNTHYPRENDTCNRKENTNFYNYLNNIITWRQVDQTLICTLMIVSAFTNFNLCEILYDDAFLQGIAYFFLYRNEPANF